MSKLFHDPDLQRISYLDNRYYTLDNENFYPSVTTILNCHPKGAHFYDWLKSNGFNSDIILERAGREGTNVHGCIEDYLAGHEVTWADDSGKAKYNLSEWTQFLKFVDFWETHRPKLIASEMQMVSEKRKTGGTTDIICELDSLVYMIDVKTSNHMSPTHELQLAAYTRMYNELFGIPQGKPVEKYAILWTKAQTRGPDKTGRKIQGRGWCLKTFDRPIEDALRVFDACHLLWLEENPNYKPANKVYPDRVKMSV